MEVARKLLRRERLAWALRAKEEVRGGRAYAREGEEWIELRRKIRRAWRVEWSVEASSRLRQRNDLSALLDGCHVQVEKRTV